MRRVFIDTIRNWSRHARSAGACMVALALAAGCFVPAAAAVAPGETEASAASEIFGASGVSAQEVSAQGTDAKESSSQEGSVQNDSAQGNSAQQTVGTPARQASGTSTQQTSAAAPGSRQPQVKASLSADTVLIGDQFTLRVEVTKDVMQVIVFPEFENGRLTDSLEILRTGPVDTLSRQGRTEVIAREYLLTCFSPADYRLGRFPALYAGKNVVDTLWSVDSVRVIVTAPAVDTTSQTIYDIKPPLKVPLRFGEVSGYLLLGLLLALVIALLVYYLVIKRGKGLLAALRKPADPPHVAAIKQLEKLHTQKLWQSGKQKQYYTALTDILRGYLEGRYNFQAMEMTSAEIIAKVRELPVDDKASLRLRELLELADFVKFAKYEPQAEQNEQVYTDAYYFIEETKELPAELQQGAGSADDAPGGPGAPAAGKSPKADGGVKTAANPVANPVVNAGATAHTTAPADVSAHAGRGGANDAAAGQNGGDSSEGKEAQR